MTYLLQPYFYIIRDKRNGMLYGGSKFSTKDSFPELFWKEGGYFTSSPTIHSIIDEHGPDVFEVVRLIPRDDAYDYETRFLRKVDAGNNPRFYNGHNNEKLNHYTNRKTFNTKFGVDYPFQLDKIRQKSKQTLMETHGVDNPAKVNPHKVQQTMIDRYGVDNYFKTGKQIEAYYLKTGYICPMQNPEIKVKIAKGRDLKCKRKDVILIKRYVKAFKVSIPRGWYQMDDFKIKCLKEDLINKFGGVEILVQKEMTPKSKPKGNRITSKQRSNREIVNKIKNWFNSKGVKKIPLGRAWIMKSTDELTSIFNKLTENDNAI